LFRTEEDELAEDEPPTAEELLPCTEEDEPTAPDELLLAVAFELLERAELPGAMLEELVFFADDELGSSPPPPPPPDEQERVNVKASARAAANIV
jgi:hypothetical protein